MKKYFVLSMLLFSGFLQAQTTNDGLNTAKDCLYMTPAEREMIYELNVLRTTPKVYIQYLIPMLNDAKKELKKNGKGQKNYSVSYSETSANGKNLGSIDTTWNFENVEAIKAISSLINDLKHLKKLPILLPDSGIYNAAKKHAADENAHGWKLLHTGSDGSQPLDRIKKFSPAMISGNENIAGRYGYATSTPRDIVLQLLIDAGIPDYGHRYNMLNSLWTFVACRMEKYRGYQDWWIQDFGVKKD